MDDSFGLLFCSCGEHALGDVRPVMFFFLRIFTLGLSGTPDFCDTLRTPREQNFHLEALLQTVTVSRIRMCWK